MTPWSDITEHIVWWGIYICILCPKLRVIKTGHGSTINRITGYNSFLAPRWLWSGNSYFDRTQLNSGSSIGSRGSNEAFPQIAFNKTADTDRHIMIVEKTRKQVTDWLSNCGPTPFSVTKSVTQSNLTTMFSRRRFSTLCLTVKSIISLVHCIGLAGATTPTDWRERNSYLKDATNNYI